MNSALSGIYLMPSPGSFCTLGFSCAHVLLEWPRGLACFVGVVLTMSMREDQQTVDRYFFQFSIGWKWDGS